ncbi:hypothetical protein EX410_18195 [Salmonella enterica]|nr:hypothetical protein [Salmonella enterica]
MKSTITAYCWFRVFQNRLVKIRQRGAGQVLSRDSQANKTSQQKEISMSNKVQVIFTAECEQGNARTKSGFKVIPTTVSIQVDSDGLENGNNSPEQLFGKILMKEAPVIAQLIQEQVYNVMRKNGSFIFSEKATETTINKEQTH